MQTAGALVSPRGGVSSLLNCMRLKLPVMLAALEGSGQGTWNFL